MGLSNLVGRINHYYITNTLTSNDAVWRFCEGGGGVCSWAKIRDVIHVTDREYVYCLITLSHGQYLCTSAYVLMCG